MNDPLPLPELAHIQCRIRALLVENNFVVEPWRGIEGLLVDTCTFIKNGISYHFSLSLRDIGEDLKHSSIGFSISELNTAKILHPNTTIRCMSDYEEVLLSKVRSVIAEIG